MLTFAHSAWESDKLGKMEQKTLRSTSWPSSPCARRAGLLLRLTLLRVSEAKIDSCCKVLQQLHLASSLCLGTPEWELRFHLKPSWRWRCLVICVWDGLTCPRAFFTVICLRAHRLFSRSFSSITMPIHVGTLIRLLTLKGSALLGIQELSKQMNEAQICYKFQASRQVIRSRSMSIWEFGFQDLLSLPLSLFVS